MKPRWIDPRIAQLPQFRGLSCTQLAHATRAVTVIRRPAGARLTHEGRQGYELVALLDGEAVVRRGDRPIATASAGDVVGEIALLEHRARTATVEAVTPVTIAVIERREFLGLLELVPVLAARFREVAARRLAELDELAERDERAA